MSAAAGYSGTPLPRKLGIGPGHRVALLGSPGDLLLEPLPEHVTVHRRLGAGPYDVIVAFCADQATLAGRLNRLRERLAPAGGLWIAWPKKSSGVSTDLAEDVLREIILPTGLVDNKVCAVDATWSGLRFVIRLADR